NKVAHRFEFKIGDDDVAQLQKDFPEPVLKDAAKKDRFWRGLGLSIIVLEQERRRDLTRRVIMHKAETNLRRAVDALDKVEGTSKPSEP
ncbi:hypothetical protein, partial [Corallococcus praedator]|uniref:hypothetical protein n=1 Tax=Corallococcus praedator TaxID=2316724 RepID=UPI001315407F